MQHFVVHFVLVTFWNEKISNFYKLNLLKNIGIITLNYFLFTDNVYIVNIKSSLLAILYWVIYSRTPIFIR
jgi:hypothetical protein